MDSDCRNQRLLVSHGSSTTKIDKQERKLIGIDGYWYDIGSFIPHHPGGEVINEFVGKDASSIFHAFHKQSVLKHRKPCAKMEQNEIRSGSVNEAFTQLGLYFEREGYFVSDYYWYAKKFALTLAILIVSISIVIFSKDSWCKYIGAVGLAAFWQQCGFFMHDTQHNQLTQNRHIDSWLGTFFATFCFGVSATWWRNEHFMHHALTACVNYEQDFFDPQMREAIWAQNRKLWPFYRSKLEYFCIKIQHITFLPVCIIIGRIGIMIDSMKDERKVREICAYTLHWVWVGALLSTLLSWKERIIFYSIASFLQGILHIQLLISHYSKDFHYVDDIGTKVEWYQMQVESNIDIDSPWWMDWFHGGLNFHLVHHLYPRMPRYNFRKATAFVRKVCKEQTLPYDHCGWFEAVYRTVSHLKLMAKHFSLDPR